VFLGLRYTAARRGRHVVATGLAESVAEHGDELNRPADLDAALADLIEVERKKLGQERT
jgi:hypothetical protein